MSREYAILSRRVFIAAPAMPSGCLCLAHDDLACRLILGGPVPSFPFVKLVAFVRVTEPPREIEGGAREAQCKVLWCRSIAD
jgi:hypothetical protein